MKKNTRKHYHFSYVYHKLQSYDVWFLRYEGWRTEFFVILDCFLPFAPLTPWKIKILNKWKESLEISSFYNSIPKIPIICYTAPEIWHMTIFYYFFYDVIIFHFGLFFAILPLKTAPKIKIFKKWKKHLEISLFYICFQKLWSDDVQFLRYGVWRTDGQTDGF